MTTTLRPTEAVHEKFFSELVQVIVSYNSQLTAEEMLAITANVVGKLIALQDKNKTTAEKAMHIVTANIELGNQQVLAAAASGELDTLAKPQ